MAYSLASHISSNDKFQSGGCMIGGDVKLDFNNANAFSHSFDHTNGVSLDNNDVRGRAIDLKSLINRL